MKKYMIALTMVLIILFLAACGSEGEQDASAEQKETVTIEHELDTVEVEKNPEKVVVFDYGILGTLDELGIDVEGIPQAGTIPNHLEKYAGDDYANLGSLKEPNFETIAEIDPDVIIISGRQAPIYDQFAELAPTVHLDLDLANYMDSFKHNMGIVGEIFDKEEEMEQELAKVDERITNIQEQTAEMDEQALIVLANDDKISAYGQNSRFGMIHDVFGIPASDDGIEASNHGMNVSFEYVMQQNPDIIYVVDRGAVVGGEASESAKQIVENQLVENTNAFKEDNIFYLDPEYWYLAAGGLLSVVEMVNEIEDSLN